MSFNITCNKCGCNQTFKDNDSKYGENIEVGAYQSGYENYLEEVILYCENVNCLNSISIKFN